jgi:hypothetical protein
MLSSTAIQHNDRDIPHGLYAAAEENPSDCPGISIHADYAHLQQVQYEPYAVNTQR